MTTFFTSDTHYSHANIIKYCNRPWATVAEMNAGLVANHNAVVKPGDLVIHIGDFSMGPKASRYAHLPMLNGKIILVRGNHDESSITKLKTFGFEDVVDTYDLVDPVHGKIHCAHVPNLLHSGDYHFCGHVHEQWRHHYPKVINVGVDVRDYRPATADDLIKSFLVETTVV